ncbi:hypothetical protein AU468_14360 [Alkalispirochaeta sphaeroplastigenens]|uniref:Uncharacterized protein n=1 Tax=Alkalispirochaeta sphaeroplastigenens TaxID=1187066 RepID=A0A2S4JF74_9SPIO|nr:hypothetical protein [Alkalispirochaeta sphaeroplastigenens]POQ98214.1 hypothetical protein AU468_14360 [Alkalispirochaeta sphaeroplastigenens]
MTEAEFESSFESLVLPFANELAREAQQTIVITHREDLPLPAVLHTAAGRPPVIYHAARDGGALHGIATQLGTFERVLRARRAGTQKMLRRDQRFYNRFQDSCSAKISAMRQAGVPDARIAPIVEGWFNGLINNLLGTPLHLLVEFSLARRFPGFEELQLQGMDGLVRQSVPFVRALQEDSNVPPFVAQATMVLALVMALALVERARELGADQAAFDHVADFGASRPRKAQAREFLRDLRDQVQGPAGVEWDLVHSWAKGLHLDPFFETAPDPASPEGGGFLPGHPPVIVGELPSRDESSQEDQEEDALLVESLTAALRYFGALSQDQIKRITLEMAEIGSAGFNPRDTSRRYTLPAIPGTEFTGQELLAWTYAGFQLVNPEVETGLDFSRAYRRALDLA